MSMFLHDAGPMYAIYNKVLRDVVSDKEADRSANCYPTTLALIVSGIRKLAAIAEMPAGRAAYRGLSGLALPVEFFKSDEQGFAGGVGALNQLPVARQCIAMLPDMCVLCVVRFERLG